MFAIDQKNLTCSPRAFQGPWSLEASFLRHSSVMITTDQTTIPRTPTRRHHEREENKRTVSFWDEHKIDGG